jgi:hypothetical protein
MLRPPVAIREAELVSLFGMFRELAVLINKMSMFCSETEALRPFSERGDKYTPISISVKLSQVDRIRPNKALYKDNRRPFGLRLLSDF